MYKAIIEIEEITKTDYNQILLYSTLDDYHRSLMVFAENIPIHKQNYLVANLKGNIGEAFMEGKIVYNNWIKPTEFDDDGSKIISNFNYYQAVPETKAELVVPIRANNEIIGVINSESEEKNWYYIYKKRISIISRIFGA